MADKPMLFNGEMVRALLDGRKTQTRRIIKAAKTEWNVSRVEADGVIFDNGSSWLQCDIPYKIGDRIWVRETFAIESNINFTDISDQPYEPPFKGARPIKRELTGDGDGWEQPHYRATDKEPLLDYNDGKGDRCIWKPSIFMPRWASRITLVVTDVRVERVADIGEADARAEGVWLGYLECDEHNWSRCPECGGTGLYTEVGEGLGTIPNMDCNDCATAKQRFNHLWNSINEKRGFGWDKNPWVYVLTFDVHQCNIDRMDNGS